MGAIDGTRTGVGDVPFFLCSSCRAPLAYDQRYCVDCGTRRDPLPAEIAGLIEAIAAEAGARPPGLGEGSAIARALHPGPPHRGSPGPARRAGGRRAGEARVGAGGPALAGVCAATLAAICALGLGVVAGNAAPPGRQQLSSAGLLAAVGQSVAVVQEEAIWRQQATAAAAAAAAAAATPAAVPRLPIPTPTPTPASPAPTTLTKPKAPAATKAPHPTTPTPATSPAVVVPPPLPDVKHVFLVMLSDNGFDAAFGPASASPYLARTLTAEGELLPNYYAVASGELANEIAVISGQGPTPQTAADCPDYTAVDPATLGPLGQTVGAGCVYPATTKTLADELTAGGDTWKAYVEDAGNGGPGVAGTCRHPTLGGADPDQAPVPGDAYVTWGDPFVYFDSLVGSPDCGTDDVGLDQLASDLETERTTPSFSYIVPNRCHDGSPVPCSPGAPAGLAATDTFLRTLVPEITGSAAYKDGGLLAITFDQAPQTGPAADSSGCCDTPVYPNLAGGATGLSGATGATGPGGATPATGTTGAGGATPATGTTTATGATGAGASVTSTAAGAKPADGATTSTSTTGATGTAGATTQAPITPTGGGGRVGLLLISQFVEPGSIDETAYNHFSLLASVQDLFELPNIGYAGIAGLPVFDASVYNGQASSGGG